MNKVRNNINIEIKKLYGKVFMDIPAYKINTKRGILNHIKTNDGFAKFEFRQDNIITVSDIFSESIIVMNEIIYGLKFAIEYDKSLIRRVDVMGCHFRTDSYLRNEIKNKIRLESLNP